MRIQNRVGVEPGASSIADRSLLERIADEPALVQLVLVIILGILTWWVLARMARSVRAARGRAAVQDFLLGIEQALHGDAKGAVKRLERVLAEDPENATARLYYAAALAQIGKAGEAHKHHVQLERGFGLRSRSQRLAAARTLLDTDRAAEAAELLAAVAGQHTDDVAAHRLLLRAQLAAGHPADAGSTAQKLRRLLPQGEELQRVMAEGARAFALAAKVRIGAGDITGARDFVQQAALCDCDSDVAQLLAARIEFHESGETGLRQRLLAEDVDGRESAEANSLGLTPSAGDPTLPSVESKTAGSEPTQANPLSLLTPRAPFRCDSCDAGFADWIAECPHCGAKEQIAPWEPGVYRELGSPMHVLDEIEQNRSHVRRLLDSVARGDSPEAVDALVAVGAPAVEETLTRAVERGPEDEVFIPVLERMGSTALPALFAAYEQRSDDWFARFGELLAGSSASSVVGRVVQSYGRSALPQFEAFLDSADRSELRKVILDFYIGLADQAEFRKVLERFPLVEVVRRLDATTPAVLQRFLATVEADSFQAEVLLLEPSFDRDTEVFFAIAADCADSATLESILERREFNPNTCRLWIDELLHPVLGVVAARLLDRFAPRSHEFEITAFTNLDRSVELREELRGRLGRAGKDVVGLLCDCLGAAPSPLDANVVEVLGSIGDGGIDALIEAYRRGSVLEKFARPLVKRHVHRRQLVARVLGQIGTVSAERGLEELRAAETDPNLKLRLDQALHRARASVSAASTSTDEGASADEQGEHGQAG